MSADLLHALFALAAFAVPVLFAWIVVHRGALRHHRRGQRRRPRR